MIQNITFNLLAFGVVLSRPTHCRRMDDIYEQARKNGLEAARRDMLESKRSVRLLNAYAGERTLINKQQRERSLRDGSYTHPFPATDNYLYRGEQRDCFTAAVEAIETVDCLDAGKKSEACEELKKSIRSTYFAYEIMFKHYV